MTTINGAQMQRLKFCVWVIFIFRQPHQIVGGHAVVYGIQPLLINLFQRMIVRKFPLFSPFQIADQPTDDEFMKKIVLALTFVLVGSFMLAGCSKDEILNHYTS